MMNRYTLSVIVAFLAGGCVGYLFAEKKLDKKYALRAEEEIESFLRAQERKKVKEAGENIARGFQEGIDGTLSKTEIHNHYSSLTRNAYEQAKEHYSLVKPNRNMDEDDFVDEVNPHPPTLSDLPYLIPENSFTDDFENHDKIALTYYTDDGLLVDEDDIMIDIPDMIVGIDNLDVNDSQNTIYVRNEKLGADYEISIVHGAGPK